MHTVIFKNDAVGDLVHSLSAINNITSSSENKKITIFLSKLNNSFSFLIKKSNVDVKILNYHLNIIEKIKIIFFLTARNIKKVYILSPKSFYFILPLIFWRTKFYAICVNNINNYKRPNLFLRKFLFKYKINDREKIYKRESSKLIQEKLTSNENFNKDFKLNINLNYNSELNKYLPKSYIYFHYKKKICDELNWGINELQILFKNFIKYHNNIVITRDIESWDLYRGEKNINKSIIHFEKHFNIYDLKHKKFTNNNSNILLLDNIFGEDLFNVIKNSDHIVAFHGMMTILGNTADKKVLDLWYSKIKSWHDYRKYRNAFYEFKPKSPNYDFIIPKKNIYKTINKMAFSLKND